MKIIKISGVIIIGLYLSISLVFADVTTDPDITGIGGSGGASEGGDVGFGNITATSLGLSGDLTLADTTSSSTGIVYKGATSFMHNAIRHPLQQFVTVEG